MTKRLLVALLVCSAMALAERPAYAQHAECSHLVMLKFPDVKISAATAVPAATTGPIRAAHCKVDGVIGTEIKFQLLLPDEWNHKFFMGGGGGFVGTVQNSAAPTVNEGYATVGTDTGHSGGPVDGKWALNNIERRVNFGYLAVHRTADVAKAIIASYYGSSSTKNYFLGCSRGGGQAMMEAVRYPDDFDGVVAGAPAMDWTGIGAEFIKDAQAAFPAGGAPLFTPEIMKSVGMQILAACDAIDGVKDGVMEDPRKCKVDINALTGLSDAQKTALKKIYGEVRTKEGVLYPGQPFGGEDQQAGWPTWVSGGGPLPGSLRYGFGTELFKYFVFNDPNWDYTKYEFTNFKKDTELTASYLNSNNPDLDAFKSKGHKVIMWHGWADAGLSPFGTVQYYEQVESRDPKAQDYFRLFMLPGVLHCGGGAGPDTVDWTHAIADWVEKGTAPDRLTAKKMSSGAATMSRPVCPYPQHAVYSGTGDPNDEKNFACKTQ
ncbi:MAG TPA: tannase/feruloyl esterase family alpha/beta hydrolase [Vicinamibacterales bacterium]|nr:tannase/feruloyl esterase family alpha/beta hydrolase [Vicinamibacterales bacterium]